MDNNIDKTAVGSPYKHQHTTNPDEQQLKVVPVFLVSAIVGENEIVPVFITDNPTFGIRHFNTWKLDHGFAENVAKVEQLPYITEVSIVEKDPKLIIDKMKKKYKGEVKNEY